MNCTLCGKPDAHPGTRRCVEVGPCVVRADFLGERQELFENLTALGIDHGGNLKDVVAGVSAVVGRVAQLQNELDRLQEDPEKSSARANVLAAHLKYVEESMDRREKLVNRVTARIVTAEFKVEDLKGHVKRLRDELEKARTCIEVLAAGAQEEDGSEITDVFKRETWILTRSEDALKSIIDTLDQTKDFE